MNELKPENPPAFPGLEIPAGGLPGMTLRDYFAAQALANAYFMDMWASTTGHDGLAKQAYALADSMLKTREA